MTTSVFRAMFNFLPFFQSFLLSSLLLPVLFMGISLPTHALADDEELEKEFMLALAADEAGDCDKALPLYVSLSDEGVPGAMINLGNMYLTGRCVEKDPNRALALLNVAVSYQTPVAHIHLANLYYEGHLGEPDYKRAYLHLSRAAKMGLLNRPLFATMHYQGQGVEKEPLQAEYILLEGIKAGDETSKTLLIEYYSDQNGPLYAPEKARQLK
jgi:TPR repeat protein